MVTQGSQSLALGLAMTAASQLDYLFYSLAGLLGKAPLRGLVALLFGLTVH